MGKVPMVGDCPSIDLYLLQECLFLSDLVEIKESFGASVPIPKPFGHWEVVVALNWNLEDLH